MNRLGKNFYLHRFRVCSSSNRKDFGLKRSVSTQSSSWKQNHQHQLVNGAFSSESRHQQTSNVKIVAISVISILIGSFILSSEAELEALKADQLPVFTIDGQSEFQVVIAGGGTAGCIAAYFIASIMEQNHIPGTVLLLDRGPAYNATEGPDPWLPSWYNNWGSFGEAHPSFREDGSDYPVTASTHNGVGGCGTHDTRITFLMRPEQRQRVATLMGWDVKTYDIYYQAALNLMPLTRALSNRREGFYDAWIQSMTNPKHARPLKRLENDVYPAEIVSESIAEPLMAFYDDELRWTSAYLVSPGAHRPRNLRIVCQAVVDRIVLSHKANGIIAHGVVVYVKEKPHYLKLAPRGEIALTSGALGNVGILQRSGIGAKSILDKFHIPCLVDNPEVGHGVDHPEIAVMYEWLDQWREQDGSIPRGGVTGWPLILFSSSKQGEFMAHAGAGYAEPYTAFPSVVATPNCMRPALQAGYRAAITSTSPLASLTLIHADQTEDYKAMAGGVQRCVELFEYMKEDRVVGRRILPPAEVNVQDMEQLTKWISENHYTAYHWAATCKSGLEGAVADSHFRVRTVASKGKPSPTAIIPNLRIGSAAALPELPEANPHLSITAFSIALADVISREQAAGLKIPYKKPIQLNKANEDLSHNNKNGGFVLRNSGQATPNLANVAKEYAAAWSKNH